MPKGRPATEEEILHILDLHENEGLTCEAIGNRTGRTKNSIVGMIYRIKKATKPSEHDGTMPRKWWAR